MWRLVKYLEENEQSILSSSPSDQAGLVAVLQEIWQGGGQEKDCAALAAAVTASFYLGRRAQQAKDSSSNDKSAERFFREAVAAAFETGKQSAITGPP